MDKMLGYSSYSNEQQYNSVSNSYNAISKLIEHAQKGKSYGTGLDTILIFYNFEAVPNEFAGTNYLNKKIEVQRYNSKEKSLRVNVFVAFDELTSRPFEEQITFYFNITLQAILMVKSRFDKNKNSNINVDFDRLILDVEQAFSVQYPELYAAHLSSSKCV